MKRNNYICFLMSSVMLFSSCTSYRQFSAATTGASIGSNVGRTIGFLTSGRGYSGKSQALGSLIGMGVGAAVGVGIANSIENRSKAQYSSETQSDNTYVERQSYNSYDNGYTSDYQIGGGASGSVSSINSNSNFIIHNVTYMDADGDGYIGKGETCQVDAYIKNVSAYPISNVTITLVSDQEKRVVLSNPLMTTLEPGQNVHYSGRVYCLKAKSNQGVNVVVNVSDGNTSLNSNTIYIPMK